ncbi:MAG TPA: helicase-related protein [Polyangiales bacterium]|nr:helicase-related protein [Polyangiales bacterium]
MDSEQEIQRKRSPVLALLGPTNTGKTHRAIERMLEFDSGMMGLPLRLLAREVYDRVSSRLGEQAVALITGEEKRIPARPRYFICTVEAMPPGLHVDFLAVDEIQLVAHLERGHVFTDRLLHWRGRAETWFLGADTVESLMREQIAGLEVERLPRLSQLRYVGQASVRSLPRRSAVVAFSLQQVYALADLIKVRRRGAAVVLGALSPRVRNAQVAMYQAGEVDFLVATDAIGMGLNLDVRHVALAADSKFDGRETRALETAEMAQIVGRAGRHLRDGSFGTLSPLPQLPAAVIQRLEAHRFPAQRFAFYRNGELALDSIAELVRSLERRPADPALRLAPEADDLATLRALGEREDIRALATSPERVEALWGLCRIPNYEKRIPVHQAARLIPLYSQLIEHGRLQAGYLEEQVRALERYDGDIDVLLARMGAARTWIYVSHQQGWLDDQVNWQERTRALEDCLGDVLHQRLLERFVDSAAVRGTRDVPNADHPFAGLSVLGASAPRRGWVESVVEAGFDEFELQPSGELHFAGARIASLVRGKTLLSPAVRPQLPDGIEAGARSRIERRLNAHARDLVAHLLAPLQPPDRAPLTAAAERAPLRGLLYQLEQGLGSVTKRDLGVQLQGLRRPDLLALRRWGIHLGQACVYAREMLDEPRLRIRAALSRAWQPELRWGVRASSALLHEVSDRHACLALGYYPVARFSVRCDVLEELLRGLARLPADARADRSAAVREALLCSEDEAASILRGLPRARRRQRRRKRGHLPAPTAS